MFALVGRVPARGELIPHPAGHRVRGARCRPRRVKKLRVHMPRSTTAEAAAAKGLTALMCWAATRRAMRRSSRIRERPMPGKLSIAALAERLRGPRRLAALRCRGASPAPLRCLAMAPFFVWPVLWLTLPALVWLIDGAVARGTRHRERWHRRPAAAAAEIGWWFGFGYFLAGLFWIGEAFLVEAEIFAVLLPFAVVLMPAGSGTVLCGGNGTGGAFWRTGPTACVALALALSATEWLRGPHAHGLPLERAGLCAHLSRVADAERGRVRHLRADAGRGARLRASACAVERGADRRGGRRGGACRRSAAAARRRRAGQAGSPMPRPAMVPGVKIRIVQPSVPQREQVAAREPGAHLPRSPRPVDGAIRPGTLDNLAGITHVDVAGSRHAVPAARQPGRRWPPSAICCRGHDPHHRRAARRAGAAGGAGAAAASSTACSCLRAGGSLAALYDKIHLVPFGEYLPLQRLLEAIGLRAARPPAAASTSASRRGRCLHIPGLPPAVPLICYEAIFPRPVVQGPEAAGRHASMSPTTDGSATRPARASTCIRRACGPSRRVCRSSAPPTTGFRQRSMATAGPWDAST